MDKAIIIAGLNYWRTKAPEALSDFGIDQNNIAEVLRATDFQESESADVLGEKFQVCLREFLLIFKNARRLVNYNTILSKALETGYSRAGARRGAGVNEFLKYVVKRDKLIGLKAGGEKVNGNEFTYWIEDMFLPLCKKDNLTPVEYAAISTDGYLRTKINYFLPNPESWYAKMTVSPFDSNKTEWKIYRKNRPALILPRPKPVRELVAVAA